MAVAGSLESSDIMITVSPRKGGVSIRLDSSVEQLYGDSIRALMAQVAAEQGVANADIQAVDHGALDCTIRARLTTALRRASGEGERV